MTPGGDSVVVWMSDSQDGDGAGVFGQRIHHTGLPAGPEFLVNTYTTFHQRWPDVSMAETGEFVVVWTDGSQDGYGDGVFGQRFDSAGLAAGDEFQVNTYTTRGQRLPSVASDSIGNFVVVWQDYQQDQGWWGVFGQRFDDSGVPQGNEFQVNSYSTGNQTHGDIAMRPDGDFVVVWKSGDDQDGDSNGIFGQRFNSAALRVGDEFQINTYSTNHQSLPSSAMDREGNFVVVWNSYDQIGIGRDVFGQRFDAAGTPVGDEFLVNTHTTSNQDNPHVAMDSAGNFVVVWESEYQDEDSWGVFGQHFDADGVPVGDEFRGDTTKTGLQAGPNVAAERGGFLVAWDGRGQGDGSGIFGQRFLAGVTFADGFESGDTSAWSGTVQ